MVEAEWTFRGKDKDDWPHNRERASERRLGSSAALRTVSSEDAQNNGLYLARRVGTRHAVASVQHQQLRDRSYERRTAIE
eukprot:6172227-Pleurochrysis_carterae.AAC.2